MSDPLYLQKEYRTANEPKVHNLIRRSFVFVHSAGMRSAPEILVLEFMREVFFKQRFGDATTRARDLNPEERNEEGVICFSREERAVLYALSGRRKKAKNSVVEKFFAPAYPQLAERAWFRKSSDRVVKDFLLSGPIAQHLRYSKQGTKDVEHRQQEIVNKIYHALLGNNSCLDQDLRRKDILAVTLGPASFKQYKNADLANRNLQDKTKSESIISIEDDELATRITQDLVH